MMKSSNLFGHCRKLVVDANQRDPVDEWTSELPNRIIFAVGFGDPVPTLSGTHIGQILLDIAREGCNYS